MSKTTKQKRKAVKRQPQEMWGVIVPTATGSKIFAVENTLAKARLLSAEMGSRARVAKVRVAEVV